MVDWLGLVYSNCVADVYFVHRWSHLLPLQQANQPVWKVLPFGIRCISLFFIDDLTKNISKNWKYVYSWKLLLPAPKSRHMIKQNTAIISSSNRKYQPFPLLLYFQCLCAWVGNTIICCRCHIYIPGKLGLVSFLNVHSCDLRKLSNILRPGGRIRLLALYTTSLSSWWKRIWRYWVYKMLVLYILSGLCPILNKSSQLSFTQYMGLCVSADTFLSWGLWGYVYFIVLWLSNGSMAL